MDELQKKREEPNASEPFPRYGETYPLALAKDKKLGFKKALFSLFTGFAAFLAAALLVWVPYPGWFDEIVLDGESN